MGDHDTRTLERLAASGDTTATALLMAHRAHVAPPLRTGRWWRVVVIPSVLGPMISTSRRLPHGRTYHGNATPNALRVLMGVKRLNERRTGFIYTPAELEDSAIDVIEGRAPSQVPLKILSRSPRRIVLEVFQAGGSYALARDA